jgi:hypothetical protein
LKTFGYPIPIRRELSSVFFTRLAPQAGRGRAALYIGEFELRVKLSLRLKEANKNKPRIR